MTASACKASGQSDARCSGVDIGLTTFYLMHDRWSLCGDALEVEGDTRSRKVAILSDIGSA